MIDVGARSTIMSMLLCILIAACGTTPTAQSPTVASSAATGAPPTQTVVSAIAPAATVAPTTEATSTANAATPTMSPDATDIAPAENAVVGTVVRFSDGSNTVDVTIGEDNPAVRDFLGMLPLTVALEEFAGKEKIARLPRQLTHEGSPGSDPEDGDLIYYIPWGNLGFYYDASGISYSDQTIHLGTYTATREQLTQLEGQVSVELVR